MRINKLFIIAYSSYTIMSFKYFFTEFEKQKEKNLAFKYYQIDRTTVSGFATSFKKALSFLSQNKDANVCLSSIEKKTQNDILFIDDSHFSSPSLINFLDALDLKESKGHKRKIKKIISTGCIDNDYIKKLILHNVKGIIYKKQLFSTLTRRKSSEKNRELFFEKLINTINTINDGFACYDKIINLQLLNAICTVERKCCKEIEPSFDGNYIYNSTFIIDEKIKVLSQAEKKILLLLADGLKSREIAEKLFISTHTIDAHKAHIKEKLRIKNTNKLILFANSFKDNIAH